MLRNLKNSHLLVKNLSNKYYVWFIPVWNLELKYRKIELKMQSQSENKSFVITCRYNTCMKDLLHELTQSNP